MEIVWYGQGCFRLTERGMAAVVTDPCDPSVGLSMNRVSADIVTISYDEPECSYLSAVRGPYKVLNGPGEYEIGGVFVTGVRTFRDDKRGALRGVNTAFLFRFNGLSVLHLGALGHVPSQSEVEDLGEVDVLLIPVGGNGVLTPARASEAISMIEPRLIVPMMYKLPGLTVKLNPVSAFLKEMGQGQAAESESLKITQSDLPEQPQIVLLKPRA